MLTAQIIMLKMNVIIILVKIQIVVEILITMDHFVAITQHRMSALEYVYPYIPAPALSLELEWPVIIGHNETPILKGRPALCPRKN